MSYIYNPRRVLGSTGHIQRHVFETVIARPLLLSSSVDKTPAFADCPTAYKYFADADDLIVFMPDRELALVAQFTDDPVLGYHRVKLSSMLRLDIVAFDFSRSGGAIECELHLGASCRSGRRLLSRLGLWVGDDGTVALVAGHTAYHNADCSSSSYLFGPRGIGTPGDPPFATTAERTDGIDRAIAAALASPARSAI